ncbi:TVP38/TMEM64 family protein [Bacillus marinisedimentorum]|uniref:TVP38/TMEM64 family protein n=1 Tax=Bacillus marinisedimentorum TaxID=1821260 RepID=UPI000872A921|nr:TVP38/TMEM64 family protein [Bacillus marinisedimentorum]
MKRKIYLLLGAAGVLAVLAIINRYAFAADPEVLRKWILSFGIFSSAVYIVILAVRPLTLFPASVVTVMGGLAFGPVKGFFYTLAGALLGAAMSYLVVEKFNWKLNVTSSSSRLASLKERVEKRGFYYLLMLRILPVLNFDLVSYGSAAAHIPFRRYMAATFLGIIPGTVAYTFLGSSIITGDVELLVIAALILALLSLFARFLAKKRKGIPE